MKLRTLLLFALAGLSGACAKEEVVLFTVDAGGSNSGGASGAQNGGAAQGGAAQGGAAQGGTAQGGVTQGGAAQGGTADGGSPQFGGTFGGGPGPDGSTPCHNDSDCDVSSSCQKAHCGDDRGRCEKRPILCDATPGPVCGCDNINYWNDCLRRQAGASFRQVNDCPTPKQCRMSSECPGYDQGLGQCARLIPNGQCSPPGLPPPMIQGSCWIVPEKCDPSVDSTLWVDCTAPYCDDTCTAIQLGHPFATAQPGMCL